MVRIGFVRSYYTHQGYRVRDSGNNQRMSIKDSIIIGMGMVPRGEVAMIVALIGLSQNLINQSTYSALILMSLLTTIIPPLILRNWLFKR